MHNAPSIVVIGASTGGVRALQTLASGLSPGFPAPIVVVQHIGTHVSLLPELLTRAGALPALHAGDGDTLRVGRIYVAPPDRHVLIDGVTMRHSHGPREHHTRPAIDPLFRSAAIAAGERAIGVVLTGHLDDGTAGLQAIKACGGVTVVQDPDEAEAASMPLSALQYAEIDHVAPIVSMGPLLERLAAQAPRSLQAKTPSRLAHEHEIMLGKGDYMEHLAALGKPSTFVCPDCSGSLWEVAGTRPTRYRCHTGHAYTLRTLHHAQAEQTDEALWSAFRALQEKTQLLEALARACEPQEGEEARRLHREASELARHAEALRGMIERLPPEVDNDAIREARGPSRTR